MPRGWLPRARQYTRWRRQSHVAQPGSLQANRQDTATSGRHGIVATYSPTIEGEQGRTAPHGRLQLQLPRSRCQGQSSPSVSFVLSSATRAVLIAVIVSERKNGGKKSWNPGDY